MFRVAVAWTVHTEAVYPHRPVDTVRIALAFMTNVKSRTVMWLPAGSSIDFFSLLFFFFRKIEFKQWKEIQPLPLYEHHVIEKNSCPRCWLALANCMGFININITSGSISDLKKKKGEGWLF